MEREKRERSGEAYRLRLKGYKSNSSEQKQRGGRIHTSSQPVISNHKPQTSQTVSKNLKALYNHTNLLSLNLKPASSKNQKNSVNSKQ